MNEDKDDLIINSDLINLKKERRKLTNEIVQAYSVYSLSGLSDALTRVKKTLFLIDKKSNVSLQAENQKIKHLFLSKILSKGGKKIESLLAASGAVGATYNYSYIRNEISEALGLEKSTFDISTSLNQDFISTLATHANAADGVMLLGIASSLALVWYMKEKTERSLVRKPIEEEIALYGDNDPNLRFKKGQIEEAIADYSKIPLEAFMSNILDSWGNKAKTYGRLLIQNVILTIHEFKDEKLYKFLEKNLGIENIERLKSSTKITILKLKQKIKKTKKRFHYKTIYQRQVIKLKTLAKYGEVLGAKDNLRKKLNDDVSKINDSVYDEMLSMGIHQALKRATNDIFLSENKDEIKNAIKTLVQIADLKNLVSSDGINKYTILSNTSSILLKRYREAIINPTNIKEVKNTIRQIYRSELFKFTQSSIKQYEKTGGLDRNEEIHIKDMIIKMSYVKYKTYKRTLKEKINEFCKEVNIREQAIKEYRASGANGLYSFVNNAAEPVINDDSSKSLVRHKIKTIKNENLNIVNGLDNSIQKYSKLENQKIRKVHSKQERKIS